jgi:hypothetical protein
MIGWIHGRRTQVMRMKRTDETMTRRLFPPALRRRLPKRTLMQATNKTKYMPVCIDERVGRSGDLEGDVP